MPHSRLYIHIYLLLWLKLCRNIFCVRTPAPNYLLNHTSTHTHIHLQKSPIFLHTFTHTLCNSSRHNWCHAALNHTTPYNNSKNIVCLHASFAHLVRAALRLRLRLRKLRQKLISSHNFIGFTFTAPESPRKAQNKLQQVVKKANGEISVYFFSNCKRFYWTVLSRERSLELNLKFDSAEPYKMLPTNKEKEPSQIWWNEGLKIMWVLEVSIKKIFRGLRVCKD